jgi:hypothetical protein
VSLSVLQLAARDWRSSASPNPSSELEQGHPVLAVIATGSVEGLRVIVLGSVERLDGLRDRAQGRVGELVHSRAAAQLDV